MQKLNHFSIDVPLAACIVDATLFHGKHPNYAEFSLLLSHLREDDATTIVDLSQKMVPVLLDIIRNWPQTMMHRLRANLDESSLDENTREQHLRAEISTADLRRISAVRILGLIREARAESALKEMALDICESISLRITALRALMQVDENKGLGVIEELLSRPSRRIGVASRMVFLEDPPVSFQTGAPEEPELLIRECIDQLGRTGGERARLLLLQVLQDRKVPLVLRQFAFDLIHDAGSGTREETYSVMKVVSYLK